jgi:hypothetical protein
MRGKRKHRGEQSVPLNLTVPGSLYPKLQEILARHGFSGPSDYFQSSIRRDAGLALNEQQKTN